MRPLTYREAQHRSQILDLKYMDVFVDLSSAGLMQENTYPVSSTLTVQATEPTVVIDFTGIVDTVCLNGQPHPFTYADDRITVCGIPPHENCDITVRGHAFFSRTGEGLHRYKDPEDERIYLYTQFEPQDAHRAWPCFDQPDMKAPWHFTVKAPAHWVVTSNGVDKAAPNATFLGKFQESATIEHDFTVTEPLPAYITALVAGEYAVIDGGTWSGGASGQDADGKYVTIPLRLMCRTALAPYADSDDIFEVTRSGLDFFHERYGLTYPWGSYDQVFVPEYNLGAMENPGCVTFTESFLSRDTLTWAQRQRRANTILHEMSHMWFGDLVTPRWWNDLWLKESFADHQGTLATATATQYAGEWASFAIARKAWAYQQDQLPTTHPILADIPDVTAAKNNFDGITYAKGASVLKQLVAWVGDEAFYAAARAYFTKFAFGSAQMSDLLECLSKACGQDLSQWAHTWLDTTGPTFLRTHMETDEDGRILTFDLIHMNNADDLAEEYADAYPLPSTVIRPHRLIISTWAIRDDILVRTHRFDVRTDTQRTAIDTDGVLAYSGAIEDVQLIVINDEDLTYAVSFFDENSAAIALKYVSSCPTPITRAVMWSTVWNMVREALISPAEYMKSVLQHAPDESEEPVVRRLIDTCVTVFDFYLPYEERRSQALTCMQRIEDLYDSGRIRAGSGAEREWLRLYCAAARYVLTCDLESLPHSTEGGNGLRELSQGFWRGKQVTRATIWQARTVLAAHGAVTCDQLNAWLAEDMSGETVTRHRQALSALPDAQLRSARWQEVLSGTLSNDDLSATLAGLRMSTQNKGIDPHAFFDEVVSLWNRSSIGIGIRFVAGAFPHDRRICSSEDVHAWLEENPHIPQALQRLLVEENDHLRRAERIQDADFTSFACRRSL
ncbi:aminopeptidase N [Schaalia sp. lx-100]|uniref:aminopeptidase N n=1 Tax=Schaalia sp. lx-100 TaxID=2899081 RepID=UPI001E5F2AE3|nr:aminopeptidase N [Schaalia sp. lx-100]MCD4557997.1 aminopeptidase N [Schaalia sp. lx-100]